jgi:hypothetical protein
VLIMTTSCDAGVCVDLSCDSCDVVFYPRESTPQNPTAIWAAAMERGWHESDVMSLDRHLCPACAASRSGDRLVDVAPGAL